MSQTATTRVRVKGAKKRQRPTKLKGGQVKAGDFSATKNGISRGFAAFQMREPSQNHPLLTKGDGGKLVEEIGWNRRQEHQIP